MFLELFSHSFANAHPNSLVWIHPNYVICMIQWSGAFGSDRIRLCWVRDQIVLELYWIASDQVASVRIKPGFLGIASDQIVLDWMKLGQNCVSDPNLLGSDEI
jgi:hypothetical protein